MQIESLKVIRNNGTIQFYDIVRTGVSFNSADQIFIASGSKLKAGIDRSGEILFSTRRGSGLRSIGWIDKSSIKSIK